MATQSVADAVVVPQAKGTGLASEDDNVDAAAASLLAEHQRGEYIAEGMTFSGHDGTNDTVNVTSGYCFIEDDSTSTGGSRGSGGNPQIQSTSSSGYDTEIPNNQHYLVIFPTSVTIDVASASLNQIWVNITDVTSNNSVEVRSDGGGGTTSAPSDTFIKLGEANPDDSTADIRAGNDNPPDLHGWHEDPNSPFQASGNASNTMSLAGRYDEVYVDATVWNAGASSNNLSIAVRINGDSTANYKRLDFSGNASTGNSEWGGVMDIGVNSSDTARYMANVEYWLAGRWETTNGNNPQFSGKNDHENTTGGAINQTMSGEHTGTIASPLTSVTLVEMSSNSNWAMDVVVKGRQNNTSL